MDRAEILDLLAECYPADAGAGGAACIGDCPEVMDCTACDSAWIVALADFALELAGS